MRKIDTKCVICASKTEEAKDLIITSTVQGREIVIIGLTGTHCPECGEQYVDAESSRRTLKIANKFRKPAIVFKRKVTVSGGRRVIGIPEEIDRALGKKENVDIWLEGDKIVAEIY